MPGLPERTIERQQFDWTAVRQRIEQLASGMDEQLPREVMEQVLLERAARFGAEVQAEAEDHTEAIIFEQGTLRYAIPLARLAEIRPVQRMTILPGTSTSILGVINVRGRIVAVYSLADVERDYQREAGGYALIGQGEMAHVALHADSIIGAERISAAEIRMPPISIAGKDYITGIGREGVVFLDLEQFINHQSGSHA